MTDGSGAELLRLMRVTRLGEGVAATGRLAPGAIARTLQTLSSYRAEMDRLGVERFRAVATAAARDADDTGAFLERASEVLRGPLEVLPAEEEGRLAFLGATAELRSGPVTIEWGSADAQAPCTVLDVGGGSTELVVGHPGEPPLGMVSLATGCVRITEGYLRSDPPTAAQMAAAADEVAGLMEEAFNRLPVLSGIGRVVGVAGTVSALAMLAAGLGSYDRSLVHHRWLALGAVRTWRDRLARLPAAERSRAHHLEPGRADVVVGGAIVVVGALEALGSDGLLVSESDILDGVATSLAGG